MSSSTEVQSLSRPRYMVPLHKELIFKQFINLLAHVEVALLFILVHTPL